MPKIIAVLFEEKLEESYMAIQLEGVEPEVLFTKGPAFTKIMGPYPEPYAEATIRKWRYSKVKNPPEVNVHDPASLREKLLHMRCCDENQAEYREAAG